MSGGGGSSGQVYYANQDKLFGTQADIAQNMYNEYAARAPGYLDNTGSMVKEAMSGALATRARGQAGEDASVAMGQGLQAAGRAASRYGAEYNPNRMAQMTQDAAIQGAGMKAGAMNKAEQWAEDQKWNRNAGAYGQISGMGTGAMEGMGSAGRGYGSMASDMNKMDMANAQGMGSAGAYVGKTLFSADGGYVRHKIDGAAKMASGGLAPVNWRAQPTSGGMKKAGSGVGQFLSGMAPAALKYGLNETGIGKQISGGIKDALGGIKSAITGPSSVEMPLGTMTDVAEGAMPAVGTDTTSTALGNEAGSVAGDSVLGAAADTALSGSALDAASMAAADVGLGAISAAGGAEAGATAGSALGPIGTAAGALIGAILPELLKDGGKVKAVQGGIPRKNMKPGGKVKGPGTTTSDSVPAWLSKGEYVLNAEATKEVGVEKLDEINEQGLKKRGAKAAAQGLPKDEDGAVKLSMGGNIGIALGAGTKTLMDLGEQDRQNEMLNLQKKADTRASESHGLQMDEGRAKMAEAKAIKDILATWGAGRERIDKGDLTPFNSGLQEYNANQGVWNNGMKMQVSPDGKQLQHIAPDGKVVEALDNTPENALKVWDMAHDYKLSAASPTFYMKMREDIAKAREKALDRAHNIEREDIKDARARDMQILQFEQQSKLQANSPAWGNLALSREEKKQARAKEEAAATAAVELYKERNPNASPAQLAAVKSGILAAVPKETPYKFEGAEVANFLGSPALDPKGAPITDPLTGKQIVNRNTKREQALVSWMAKKGITDTNKALPLFLAEEANAATSSPAAAPGQFVKINGKDVARGDITSTAKKYNITEDEVVRRLVAKK